MASDGIQLSVARLLKGPQWVRLMWFSTAMPGRRCDYLATSMDLCDSPSLRAVLGGPPPTFHSRLLPARQGTLIGWGRKWSGKRAVTIAGAAGRAFLLLEDGFLRGAGRQDATLSLVFDDRGIYYDAISPSQIEAHIAAPLTPDEGARARRVMQSWRAQRVSKYNDAPDYAGPLPDRYVLVVDQVAGDLSVGYGQADAGSFQRMLRAALAEHPEATVIVKVHPDVHTRAKRGYFDLASLRTMARVRIIADHCHPVRLIEQAQAVYTVTSQVGFEALIWGRPVRCFGMPFYAGWGLTQDALPPPARRHPVTREQLVHGALIRYPRYVEWIRKPRRICTPQEMHPRIWMS
jgi:capsular polysaccharide export protein